MRPGLERDWAASAMFKTRPWPEWVRLGWQQVELYPTLINRFFMLSARAPNNANRPYDITFVLKR